MLGSEGHIYRYIADYMPSHTKMNLNIYNVVDRTLAKLVKDFQWVGIKINSKYLLYKLKPNLKRK